ncbi:chitinase [Cladophialophora yegresii CBS 114405]|uniref:Chitinase n=1 Tax=Cladophialophora yegresii CBS 114405 TaxID=1182544 RepID=W9W8A4_9EURO|nr:chitinase [Cladophialophora yegresii CBS 114405]EXJ60761.1 chitinase [Cladophialophora yegresii CBS 114405]
MPPVPVPVPVPVPTDLPPFKPRIVCYQQTYHHNDDEYCSLLPLLTNPSGITHVILAALHVNWDPGNVTLNDDPSTHTKYTQLWDEVLVLQDSGIKVLGMLGGAARGTFARLDYSESRTDVPLARFEAYYIPLRDLIRRHALDGLDLDVEEEMSLPGIVHLIDRLREDFGPSFLITLAPVATALMAGRRHLSGFDYRVLESMRGPQIGWYNAQFYNGWGGLHSTEAYDEIMRNGWDAQRVVAGMLTNPKHGGSGYVPLELSAAVLSLLVERYPRFGGVMGWEYWDALPQEGGDRAWMWAYCMGLCMGMKKVRDAAMVVQLGRGLARVGVNR